MSDNSDYSPVEMRRTYREGIETLEKLDVASLLNEDLERSRNVLVVSSLAVIFACVVDIRELRGFGVTVSFNSDLGMLAIGFGWAIVLILTFFYWHNAIVDRVSKELLSQRVTAGLEDQRDKLEKFRNYYSPRVNMNLSEEEIESARHGAELRTEFSRKLNTFEKKFYDELKISHRMQWVLAITCIAFSSIAFLIKLVLYILSKCACGT